MSGATGTNAESARYVQFNARTIGQEDRDTRTGEWIAQWIGYGPTFLRLGGFGLASIALWMMFGTAVKKY
ncbi:hypothetical protein UNPF46_11365 [Bradyrhizobium sp. UNPF46]|uniref:hypothetical protein n=1 Tax=Bradyrhizobium sp. UNPF46 TaxID=1141168 RepID=UPI00116EB215|nr:hypothetical protein [Bradyrhizobium sp. UNPF46]TQF40060.1 hypothetical protein UNPF46_11365 [Bradyrhizobium sp. UNPF46]